MSVQQLLNQFLGGGSAGQAVDSGQSTSRSGLNNLAGGFAGGAAAGGLTALLMGNKKARKFAGKAATVGGAALLGGMAFSAYKNWKQNAQARPASLQTSLAGQEENFQAAAESDSRFQLTLIKAMIAAAKTDGHIDKAEQSRIFDAVDTMDLTSDMKAMVFDLLRYPATIGELVQEVSTIEQKSEVYMVSCLAIDIDQTSEREYLALLERSLDLPVGLAKHLQQQALQAGQIESPALAQRGAA